MSMGKRTRDRQSAMWRFYADTKLKRLILHAQRIQSWALHAAAFRIGTPRALQRCLAALGAVFSTLWSVKWELNAPITSYIRRRADSYDARMPVLRAIDTRRRCYMWRRYLQPRPRFNLSHQPKRLARPASNVSGRRDDDPFDRL